MKISKKKKEKKKESYLIEISYEENCWDLLCEYYFMSEKTLKTVKIKTYSRFNFEDQKDVC